MPIHVDLNVIMAKRHISAGELAEKIDITPANLSILKNGHHYQKNIYLFQYENYLFSHRK